MSRPKMSKWEREDLAAFERLCKRVDKLDSGAAKYLRRLARNWSPLSGACGVRTLLPDADLSRSFMWDDPGLQIPTRIWCRLWERLEAGEA